jgi:crossover junction endonuclease MUS81
MSSPLQIVVDCREDALLNRMNAVEGLCIESKSLPIADIAFIVPATGQDLLLFERKTLQDLLASIKDGRYEEQSHRLLHSTGVPPHHIVYVLEGLMSQLKSDAERNLVFSTITSLSYFKGFSVFRTSTVQETADLLVAMSRKIEKDLQKGRRSFHLQTHLVANAVQHSDPSENTNAYSQFVKKVKKENITQTNIAEIMLSQIPGISASSAAEILAHYDGSILRVIEECSTETPFQHVVLKSVNGKTRKLGSNVREALVKYLGCAKK